MNDLKDILFKRTVNERNNYLKIGKEYIGRKENQHERFSSLYQLIEDAELEGEYEIFLKENNLMP